MDLKDSTAKNDEGKPTQEGDLRKPTQEGDLMKPVQTIKLTDAEIIEQYKKLKPADGDGYTHILGKNGQWRKKKIVDPEVAKIKRDHLVKQLKEKAIPAALEKRAKKQLKKKEAEQEKEKIIQKSGKMVERQEEAINEIKTVKEQINELKGLINNVKMSTVIARPVQENVPQRARSVQEILGIDVQPEQTKPIQKQGHRNPNLKMFGL